MFKKTVYSITFAVVALMFGGCAIQSHLPMTKDAQSKIQSTDVVIGLSQEEIYAEIERSNTSAAVGGGLLFALIDAAIESSRSDDAETLVTPIKNSLIDYNFPSEFETALSTELQRLTWLNSIKYQTRKPYTPNDVDSVIQAASADILLVFNTSYRFSPGLKSVKVSTAVTGYANSDELKAIAKESSPDAEKPVLYMNSFTYSQPLVGEYTDSEKASKIWSDNNAEQVRTALTEGASEIAKMVATDLEIARAQYKDKSVQVGEGNQVTMDGATGTLVSEDDKRVILRLANGSMYSAPNVKQ
ncbi:hypothetical protein [Kaarinaea lacus]